MPQYQGVWTLQQQAQAQSNQQWVTDPNFKNTTLLLQADGTGSGSQNQTFLDGSTNNFFITRNGNTTQGSFSPFSQAPGYWGNYFNGSSDYLVTNSSTALNLGANDFTVECWFYTTSTAATQTIISGVNATLGTGSWILQINNTGQLRFYCNYNGGTALDYNVGTGTVSTNTWNHFAVTRNGANLRIFLNGTQVGTTNTTLAALSIDNASGNYTIGQVVEIRAGWYFAGYISNLRVVIGTALYTSTFIPSTTPLTAVTNTKLLTSQSNRFLDNSTNSLTFTTGGTPSVQTFAPFAPALQWTSDVVGGSGYFDGSGDYLATPSTTAFNFGTGAFTMECWIYQTALSGQTPWFFAAGSNGIGFGFQNTSNWGFVQTGVAWALTSSTLPKLNAWNHVVVCRASTTTNQASLFLNGVRVANGTISQTLSYTGAYYCGYDGVQIYTGYISGLRVTNTDVYGYSNSTITVPTTPPTAVSGTQILLNYTNAGIYDGKMANNLETVGNAQVATSPVKYGSGSIYFDGSGDWLTAPLSPWMNLGTSDFTMECWVYFTSVSSTQMFFSSNYNAGTGAGGWAFCYRQDNTTLKFTCNSNVSYEKTWTPSTGQWYHVAVSRANSNLRLFVNGTQLGTTSTSTDNISSASTLYVGSNVTTQLPLFGYMDDARITVGVARYQANFTPPQQALPRQ